IEDIRKEVDNLPASWDAAITGDGIHEAVDNAILEEVIGDAILEEALELYRGYEDQQEKFNLVDLKEGVGIDGTPVTVRNQIQYVIDEIQPRRRTTWGSKNNEGSQGDLIRIRCPETKLIYELEIVGYEGWLYFITTASAGTGNPVHLRIKNDRVRIKNDRGRNGRAIFITKQEIIDTLATNNFYVSK
ncbi:hypothetical protein LCGC14_2009940, partial [marine sediment metagenome]